MTAALALPALLRAGGLPGHRLILPGSLRAPLTLARAQTGARATGLDADDVTWREFAADQPRLVGSARHLLVEGPRTNAIRNARAEGAGAGVPPTNWGVAVANGIVATIVGAVSHGGMSGVEVEYSGTAAANTPAQIHFELNNAITAAPGQIWTGSAFHRVVSGTPPNGPTTIRIWERDAAGAPIAVQVLAVSAASSALQRAIGTSSAFGATTTRVTLSLATEFLLGTTANCRIQYFWPQIELANRVSTPILPLPGSPAASTRGADILAAPLASLGIRENGACTVLMRTMIPHSASSDGAMTYAQIDGGASSDFYRSRCTSGNAFVQGMRALAGVAASSASAAVTPGVVFRHGWSLDGAGQMLISTDGQPALSLSGGPVGGLTTLRIGGSIAEALPLFGEMQSAMVLPFAVGEAALRQMIRGLA